MSSLLFKPGVHSTAVVESGAKIGNNVSIGAYSFIGPGVTIKDNAKIAQNVVIVGKTTIGENTTVYPFTVLGTPGQDLKYPDFEDGILTIGQNNIIRENVAFMREHQLMRRSLVIIILSCRKLILVTIVILVIISFLPVSVYPDISKLRIT